MSALSPFVTQGSDSHPKLYSPNFIQHFFVQPGHQDHLNFFSARQRIGNGFATPRVSKHFGALSGRKQDSLNSPMREPKFEVERNPDITSWF